MSFTIKSVPYPGGARYMLINSKVREPSAVAQVVDQMVLLLLRFVTPFIEMLRVWGERHTINRIETLRRMKVASRVVI